MSGKPFFITGLPRSRTAWLSFALSGQNTTCIHELSTKVENSDEMVSVIEHSTKQGYHFGTADCQLPFMYEHLQEAFPDAPWIVIYRDDIEVKKSLYNAFGVSDDKTIDLLMEQLKIIYQQPNTLIVDYYALNNYECFKTITKKCFGDNSDLFIQTKGWFDYINGMNITVDKDKYPRSLSMLNTDNVVAFKKKGTA